MNSLDITKINGAVNTYQLKMEYPIQNGDDPNLLEKVFSSISQTRKITLSYGDWNAPTYIYKNEEAIITQLKTNIDFKASKIAIHFSKNEYFIFANVKIQFFKQNIFYYFKKFTLNINKF